MVKIGSLARLFDSRLFDLLMQWAEEGRRLSTALRLAEERGYRFAEGLGERAWEAAREMVRFRAGLGRLGDDELMARAYWQRKRNILHAYEVTAKVSYCNARGRVVATRRLTVGFDRNPTGLQLRSVLDQAAHDRLTGGTDRQLRDLASEDCGVTIIEGWRRTAL